MASNGNTTVYTLTECLCLPLSVKSSEGDITYGYDPFGRLSEIKLGETRTTYAYDDRFNKTSKFERWIRGVMTESAEATYDSKGNLVNTKSIDGRTVTMTYDKEGRIASIQEGTGRSVKLVYNLIGKPVLITQEGIGEIKAIYGEDGNLIKVDSKDDPSVTMQVASIFNALLDSMAPFTAGAQVDSRFSVLTSEPGGCDECGRNQGD